MRLRDDYVEDAAAGWPAGTASWNGGTAFRMTLPHVAFNRRIGEFNAIHTDTEGAISVARMAGMPGSDAAVA